MPSSDDLPGVQIGTSGDIFNSQGYRGDLSAYANVDVRFERCANGTLASHATDAQMPIRASHTTHPGTRHITAKGTTTTSGDNSNGHVLFDVLYAAPADILARHPVS